MRIGIITDAFPPTKGGIEAFSKDYVEELSNVSEVELVDVLAFERGKSKNLPSMRINRVSANGTVSRVKEGISWFRTSETFDVIHSLTLYTGGLIASLYKLKNKSSNAFVTVHGTDALGVADNFFRSRIRQFVFNTVDGVVFHSDSSRDMVQAAYNKSFSSRTIYPGVPDLPDPSGMQIGDESKFTVVCVTRLVERKGVKYLIEAVESLQNVNLIIIGEGPERHRLEEKVRSLGIKNKVSFKGEVPQDKLINIYAKSDIFCLPSVFLAEKGDIEGLGLVFLEAQQFGIPVVGTNSGGIPEVIADGESGFVVEERSSKEIRTAIKRLRDDERLYERFSENAKQFVENKFSWEQCVQHHIDFYKQPHCTYEGR